MDPKAPVLSLSRFFSHYFSSWFQTFAKIRMFFFRLIIVLAVATVINSTLQSAPAISVESRPRIDPLDLVQRIHHKINEQRRIHGLSRLVWNSPLSQIARHHSEDMSTRNYFGHVSPAGRSLRDRYARARFRCAIRRGYKIYEGAENIALGRLYNSMRRDSRGFVSYDWNTADEIAEMTVAGWMRSPGHRRNILTSFYGQEGIGVMFGPGNKILITQNFC